MTSETATVDPSQERGSLALLRLAFPIFLSNSLWALQVALDRVMLSRADSSSVGAGTMASLLFWVPMTLGISTCGYVGILVAQARGAGRPRETGRLVWQGLYASALGGALFLTGIPLSGLIVSLAGHSAAVQEMEATYLCYLCVSAFPAFVAATVCAFFIGRGDGWVALLINGAGLVVNAAAAYVLIFGALGCQPLGIHGAGLAAVAGASTAALLGLALLFRRKHRVADATIAGFGWDRARFLALLRYGLPAGLHEACGVLAWAVFLVLVGRLGTAELSATSIAFTIHLIVLLPATGLAQAVAVRVGQQLGSARPDLAEQTVRLGLRICLTSATVLASLYVLAPSAFLCWFQGGEADAGWATVASWTRILLIFQAIHGLCEGTCLVYVHALRGAGDTRYPALASVVLPWPLMVLPTWLACILGAGLTWAWGFATVYVAALAGVMLARFRAGYWKRTGSCEASRGVAR